MHCILRQFQQNLRYFEIKDIDFWGSPARMVSINSLPAANSSPKEFTNIKNEILKQRGGARN